MRTILFRGQTRRKGEKVTIGGGIPIDSNWVYGGVSAITEDKEGDFSIIYQTEPVIEKFPVYTDTVSQYTGLTDKNGKKIFEGDIVKLASVLSTGVVTYHLYKFMVDDIDDGMQNYSSDMWEECKVIGNIFDNPELLKESE